MFTKSSQLLHMGFTDVLYDIYILSHRNVIGIRNTFPFLKPRFGVFFISKIEINLEKIAKIRYDSYIKMNQTTKKNIRRMKHVY